MGLERVSQTQTPVCSSRETYEVNNILPYKVSLRNSVDSAMDSDVIEYDAGVLVYFYMHHFSDGYCFW